jgi:hypothetical protein
MRDSGLDHGLRKFEMNISSSVGCGRDFVEYLDRKTSDCIKCHAGLCKPDKHLGGAEQYTIATFVEPSIVLLSLLNLRT